MKAYPLISLLAVALVANAQSSDSNSGAPTGPSSPLSDTGLPSNTDSASQPPASSAPPPPPSSSSTTTTSAAITSPPPTPPPTSLSPVVSLSTGTDSAGNDVTVEVTVSVTPPPSLSSPSASSTGSSSPSGGGGSSTLSTGGIVGLAVAGGTAVVCLIAFFVWKFTRKRSTDFDDSENIKWPELNAHNGEGDTHAMPVHNTGRAGFAGDDDLSRAPSVNTFAASSTDFHSEDPYAVPPLPHLNPGMTQPYRDDPNAGSAYYDPYRGPVPQTFNEAHGAPPADWAGGEAIPMTQMAGRASPGPGMMGGRASPGPGMYAADPYAASGRTPSPGPQAAYGGAQGRIASPGPQAAYGRASPGPQAAYGAPQGRASPGPQAAYGAQQGRASPGPQAAYGGGM